MTPSCIAGPRLDGGTRFILSADLSREVRARCRDASGSHVVLPGAWDGRPIVGDCTYTRGDRGWKASVHVQNLIYVTWSEAMGETTVQLKAPPLWSHGYDVTGEWFTRTVALWCDRLCEGLSTAAKSGWRTTGIEVCADFTSAMGLLRIDEIENWVGPKKRPKGHGPHFVDSFEGGWAPGLYAETIDIGKRKSARLSWGVYDKLAEARSDKGKLAIYAPTWRSRGWDGAAHIVRVEPRARDTALVWETESGQFVNLRDPAALTPHNIHRWWRAVTAKYRLTRADAPRRCRRSTHPLWRAVQEAGDAPPQAWRQAREAVAEYRQDRIDRSAVAAIRALSRMGVLEMGVSPRDASGLESLLGLAVKTVDPAIAADCARDYYARNLTYLGGGVSEDTSNFGPVSIYQVSQRAISDPAWALDLNRRLAKRGLELLIVDEGRVVLARHALASEHGLEPCPKKPARSAPPQGELFGRGARSPAAEPGDSSAEATLSPAKRVP